MNVPLPPEPELDDPDPDSLDEDGTGSRSGTVFSFAFDGQKERLDLWLSKRCSTGLSRSRIQGLLASGHVTIDGDLANGKSKPRVGQIVEIRLPPPEPAEPQPEDIPIRILYEDDDIIVIDKQPGLVVHPAAGHGSGTLVNAILYHCKSLQGIGGTVRPGIVHRLDKDTSGVMVVAKNEPSLNALAAQFKARSTQKAYLALVHHLPEALSGIVTKSIGRDPRDRKRMAADPPRGKEALSRWEVRERFASTALLRVRIETGRTHQIRVHLASIGFPIVGDPVYGNRQLDRAIPGCPARQMLHAAEFSFSHPADGRPMSFTVPPPEDMMSLLNALRASSPPFDLVAIPRRPTT